MTIDDYERLHRQGLQRYTAAREELLRRHAEFIAHIMRVNARIVAIKCSCGAPLPTLTTDCQQCGKDWSRG